MKDIKYIKMGESEIVLSYDSKTKLISVSCSNLGNINGDVKGSIVGSVGGVLGMIEGDVAGSIGGDVDGTIVGNIFGDIESHIYGNIWGIVHGKVVCVEDNVGKVLGEVVGLKQIESEIKLYNEEQENE